MSPLQLQYYIAVIPDLEMTIRPSLDKVVLSTHSLSIVSPITSGVGNRPSPPSPLEIADRTKDSWKSFAITQADERSPTLYYVICWSASAVLSSTRRSLQISYCGGATDTATDSHTLLFCCSKNDAGYERGLVIWIRDEE